MSKTKKYDSTESILHAVVKTMIAVRHSELKRDYSVEEYLPETGVIDNWDKSNKLIYEVQKNMSKKIIKEKTDKFTKVVGINDVIMVPLRKFNINMSLKEIYEKVKEIVV